MKRIFERKKEDKILSSSNVLKKKKNFYDDDDGFVFHYVRILSRARLWNTFFSFLFFSFLFFPFLPNAWANASLENAFSVSIRGV